MNAESNKVNLNQLFSGKPSGQIGKLQELKSQRRSSGEDWVLPMQGARIPSRCWGTNILHAVVCGKKINKVKKEKLVMNLIHNFTKHSV